MQSKITAQCFFLFSLLLTLGCAHKPQSSATIDANQQTRPIPAIVVSLSEEYANINTNISEEMLRGHGIVSGKTFAAHYRDQTVQALLGKDYSDVDRGDWIALIEEDGNLQLAISFGHAATEWGCSPGDTLFIEPVTLGD